MVTTQYCKKRGVLSISPELLLSLLNIEGQILGVRIDPFAGGKVEIVLDSPQAPDCPEGAYPYPVRLEDLQKKEENNGDKEVPAL